MLYFCNMQTTEEEESDFLVEETELYEHFRITVDKGQSKIRLDKFLFDRLPNTSRSKIQAGVDAESILVNEKPSKASYKVSPFDVITVSLPKPPRNTEAEPENIPLNIVFEDANLLIVNKKAGMVVHPAYANETGTLVNALLYHFQHLTGSPTGEERAGLVHRIDKDTSGLLVVAKTDTALVHLAKQFYDHSIERTYHALVWGDPKEDSGTIDAPLGRHPKDRRIVTVYELDNPYGKRAVTHYKVLERFRYVTLMECRLETGRTHQIRAHFKHKGMPLFGDQMYGGDKVMKGTQFSKYKSFVENCFAIMQRQALHAKSLGFIHPVTKEKLFFESELPEDFRQVLEKWEHYVKYT